MAFKLRLEYWKLSKDGDGIDTVILDGAIAPATEFEADEAEVSLPSAPGNASYAMRAYSILGAATVEVDAVPTNDEARGCLVPEGETHWFMIHQGDKVTVKEYAV